MVAWKSRSAVVQVSEDEIEIRIQSEKVPPSLADEVNSDCLTMHTDNMDKIQVRQELLARLEDDCFLNDFISSINMDDPRWRGNHFHSSKMLQQRMKELRAEMEHLKMTEYLDPKQRLEMEALFRQVEEVMELDDFIVEETANDIAIKLCSELGNGGTEKRQVRNRKNRPPAPLSGHTLLDHIRRIAVAIIGGAITLTGVALIPFPIIPGCLIIYVGLLVLATEFESAQNAKHAAKKLVGKCLVACWDCGDESLIICSQAEEDQSVELIVYRGGTG